MSRVTSRSRRLDFPNHGSGLSPGPPHWAALGWWGRRCVVFYYGMDDFARQSTAANFADWSARRRRFTRRIARLVFSGDPRREWSYRDYVNIPDKEYEVLVDLWYTNGQELTRYNALPRDAQIRVDSAFDLWQIATGRASSDPGVRRLTIRNSVTGEERPMANRGRSCPPVSHRH